MAKAVLRAHYRPHARVYYTGEIINPHSGEVTVPPSMTKQEFVRECDINNIIKAFSRTGMLNHVSARAAEGAYQDLPDNIDFQESLAVIEHAEAAFMTLPAKVRDRFGNEPERFLAFMADPANKDEIYELGLAVRPAQEAPQEPVSAPQGAEQK